MSRSSAFWTRKLEALAHQRGRVAHEADVDLGHGAEGALPHHVDLDAALVGGGDDSLDREAGLGRLHHRAPVGVDLGLAAAHHHAALAALHHHAVDDVAGLELELALVVLQLDGLDHPVGEAGAELQEGHVLADLEDLAGHLLAGLEAAAGARGRCRVGVHVGEGALVGGRSLGRRRRRLAGGKRGRGGLAGTGVAPRLAAIARIAVAAGTASPGRPPPGRAAAGAAGPRSGGEGEGACDGDAGADAGGGAGSLRLRVGHALPERTVVLHGGRGRRILGAELLHHRRLDLHAGGRGLHVALADDDRAGFALLLFGHGARVITRRESRGIVTIDRRTIVFLSHADEGSLRLAGSCALAAAAMGDRVDVFLLGRGGSRRGGGGGRPRRRAGAGALPGPRGRELPAPRLLGRARRVGARPGGRRRRRSTPWSGGPPSWSGRGACRTGSSSERPVSMIGGVTMNARPLPVLLLPGLDGSTDLFERFLGGGDRARSTSGACRTRRTASSTTPTSRRWCGRSCPRGEPFAILGESFGGPLALRVASSEAARGSWGWCWPRPSTGRPANAAHRPGRAARAGLLPAAPAAARGAAAARRRGRAAGPGGGGARGGAPRAGPGDGGAGARGARGGRVGGAAEVPRPAPLPGREEGPVAAIDAPGRDPRAPAAGRGAHARHAAPRPAAEAGGGDEDRRGVPAPGRGRRERRPAA